VKTGRSLALVFLIITWISQSLPLIKVLSASSDIEHSVDGRRSSDDFSAMPGTGVALHSQAGLAIRLSAAILKCFEKKIDVGIVLVALKYAIHSPKRQMA